MLNPEFLNRKLHLLFSIADLANRKQMPPALLRALGPLLHEPGFVGLNGRGGLALRKFGPEVGGREVEKDPGRFSHSEELN